MIPGKCWCRDSGEATVVGGAGWERSRLGQVGGDFTGAPASLDRAAAPTLGCGWDVGLAREDQQVFNMIGRQDFGARFPNHSALYNQTLPIDCRRSGEVGNQKLGVKFEMSPLINLRAITL